MKIASICLLLLALGRVPLRAGPPGSRASEPLVDIQSVDPTILVELRYSGSNNVLGHPFYPPGARPVARQSVADRLKVAQAFLKAHGAGLKILDAYRPPDAQHQLWQFARNGSFVSNPETGYALHTWGVAVDATLVDPAGHELPMPSPFDAFSDDASMHYKGDDATIHYDLKLLEAAMGSAGFLGMRTEWWHFVAPDWQDFAPVTPEQARVFTAPPASPPPKQKGSAG